MAKTFTELEQFELSEEVIRLLPVEFCLEHRVVVLGAKTSDPKEGLPVGMLKTDDQELLNELAKKLTGKVKPIQLNEWEILQALSEVWEIEEAGERVEVKLSLHVSNRIHFDGDQPAKELIQSILSTAIVKRATDVHIECYRNNVDLRFRIDSVLHQINNPLSKGNVNKFVSALKVMSNLRIEEKRIPQDGVIRAQYMNPDGQTNFVDLRLSILPGLYGEDCVIRILRKLDSLETLGALGMNEATEQKVLRAIQNPYGLILISGPSGSGKSTTFFSLIKQINTDGNKILSIENPIEYEMHKVNQKQVSHKMDFAEYTRAFMRQDPDILLVGEINNEDTAQVCTRASQTGHTVYSTIHANDAVGVILRMQLLGIQPDILADNLTACLSQRLLRRLCTHCCKQIPTRPEMAQFFASQWAETQEWVAEGCAKCDGIGYHGRVGVYEVFLPNEKIRHMISEETTMSHIRQELEAGDFQSMLSDGLEKSKQGLTSLDEIRRVVQVKS